VSAVSIRRSHRHGVNSGTRLDALQLTKRTEVLRAEVAASAILSDMDEFA
jgi:hypothetical protein